MKLKDSFITQKIEDRQFLFDAGESDFDKIVSGNESAAFIIELLETETTEDEITDKMAQRYDAPRKVIKNDVRSIIDTLRKIGALDE